MEQELKYEYDDDGYTAGYQILSFHNYYGLYHYSNNPSKYRSNYITITGNLSCGIATACAKGLPTESQFHSIIEARAVAETAVIGSIKENSPTIK